MRQGIGYRTEFRSSLGTPGKLLRESSMSLQLFFIQKLMYIRLVLDHAERTHEGDGGLQARIVLGAYQPRLHRRLGAGSAEYV